MQNTPPPPRELAEEVAALSQSMRVVLEANDRLQREVDELRIQIGMLELRGGAPRVQEPKVADPPMFKGDQRELEGWIIACRLKFAGQRSRFPDESAKVIFAASFLEGPPKNWVQPLVTAFLSEGPEPKPEEFRSFETFVASLKALYGDPNLARNALLAIEHLRQTTSVADYISRFAGHSQYTGLGDEALVRYFYKGLKDGIKDELATREYTTLKELQNLATWLDARQHERMLERMMERNRGTAPKANSPSMAAYPPRAKPVAPTPAAPRPPLLPSAPMWRAPPTRTPAPALDGSTPMELDSQGPARTQAERDRRSGLGLCWNCGAKGHRKIDCPLLAAVTAIELDLEAQEPEKEQAQE